MLSSAWVLLLQICRAFVNRVFRMTRSTAVLVVVLVLACGAVQSVLAQNLPVPPLKYDYDALEPHVPTHTLQAHHLGHLASYTTKLNDVLAAIRTEPQHKYLAKMGIDKLLTRLDEVPEVFRDSVRNNGGGYVNHQLYFDSMSPAGGAVPTEGAFHDAVVEQFGGFDGLVAEFTRFAKTLFGSGYTWLLRKYDGHLEIVNTANQDSPIAHEETVPLLVLDVVRRNSLARVETAGSSDILCLHCSGSMHTTWITSSSAQTTSMHSGKSLTGPKSRHDLQRQPRLARSCS